MAFRFNAKNIFLTYPQCELSYDEFENEIKRFNFKYYRICREQHKDGHHHFHAYGEWSTARETRNNRYFDIRSYHPNISRPRVRDDILRYISKEGEVREYGTATRVHNEMHRTNKQRDSNYEKLSMAVTRADYKRICKEKFPYQYYFNHRSINYYLENSGEKFREDWKNQFKWCIWELEQKISYLPILEPVGSIPRKLLLKYDKIMNFVKVIKISFYFYIC